MKTRTLLITIFCLITSIVIGQNTHILPTPQEVIYQEGNFLWTPDIVICYDLNDKETASIVNLLREDLTSIHATSLPYSKGVRKGQHFIELSKIEQFTGPNAERIENQDQAYRMVIASNFIRIEATSEEGLFYGTQSLKQLFRYAFLITGDNTIPCMEIMDWPNFRLRGWQDDISRGPIVTMDYLKQLIPQMAECKVNFMSLYTEHTFKSQSHPDVSPVDGFSPEEIKELEDYCKKYHIQLIGNQQCFAHFEEILKNPFYEYLADASDNINPALETSYEFLEDLISEEAAVYTHPLFNINCDETESLGSGKAKAYVDSLGMARVYYEHLNRVNAIVKKYEKRSMMWGDIADRQPEILEHLDKDIILLAWSYAARDSFEEFLKPYVNSGHEFMVAPGLSLSGKVWPSHSDYTSDIPHLCRDGYYSGAFGVMNTCWDDFGESLTNSGLYGLALGAEMSWNPIKEKILEKADIEQAQRQTETNFSIHFLGYESNRACELFATISELSKDDEMGPYSAMTKSMLPFYPSLVGQDIASHYQTILNEWFNEQSMTNNILEQIRLEKQKATRNQGIFDNASYAAHRLQWCAKRNLTRCQLYNTYLEPSDENISASIQQVQELIDDLYRLKCEYIPIWKQENRTYWLDVNMEKYNTIAKELLQLEYTPFFEQDMNQDGNITVSIRTLYNDKDLFYTIGDEVVNNKYESPIILQNSCTLHASCKDSMGRVIESDRTFLYHKGLGKLKELHSPAGNYRPEYSGGSDGALLDGALGSNDYKDGHWQGFYGIDADLEIDLRKKETLSSLEIGFLTNPYDWILCPQTLEVYTSSDGNHYTLYNKYSIQTEPKAVGNTCFTERFSLKGLSTRYLRIIVKNPGILPEGLPGAGYDSWIFMDEIIIR